jgi:hypothetical protein
VAAVRVKIALLALLALASLPACRAASSEEAEVPEPFTIEPIEGTDLNRLVLEKDALRRIRLETAPVEGGGRMAIVPTDAIWIDVEGRSWVYTETAPRTFVRAEVIVDRYDDGRALVEDGPPVGTPVVTVGVAELIGSEFGI